MRIASKAFAKINWSLDILSAREDGYHEMDMLMQRISLHDEIVFSSARNLSLSINGRVVPWGGKNLVVRAASALSQIAGRPMGARIEMTKRIPIRAGLGGGSADCCFPGKPRKTEEPSRFNLWRLGSCSIRRKQVEPGPARPAALIYGG